MEVILSINEIGELVSAEFDDLAGLEVDPDCEDLVDLAHKTAVVIPDSVKRIGDWAFYDRQWLTGITLPGSVLSIGHDAFTDCSYLTKITLAESVKAIGARAFS